jgi:hypothetical protein
LLKIKFFTLSFVKLSLKYIHLPAYVALYTPFPYIHPEAPPTPGEVPPGEPFEFISPPEAVPPTPTEAPAPIAVAPNAVAITVPALFASVVLPPAAATVRTKLVANPTKGV